SNTFVPINSPRSGGANTPLRPCVAVVQVATRNTECLVQTEVLQPGEARRVLRNINWQKPQVLELQYTAVSAANRGRVVDVFSRQNGTWKSTDILPSENADANES